MASGTARGLAGPAEEKFLEFPSLPDDATRDGKPALNKYSQFITKGHDFPGAQVWIRDTHRYPGLDAGSLTLEHQRPCCMRRECRTGRV